MTIKDFGVVNGNQATLLQYSDGFGCLRILDAKERGQLKIEQEQNPAQDENGLITF